jgi:CRISPR-associated endonuclease Cas1
VNSEIALVEDAIQFDRARPHNDLLALSGYGISLLVKGGHLVVEDGVGSSRRRGRFARANPGFRRLVVLGHSGIVSLEALRWLSDIGAAFVNIDCDGNLIAAIAPTGLNDARLRRAQALASANGVGLEIARELIRRKLVGQLQIVERLRDGAAMASISAAIKQIGKPRSIDQLRLLESQAAVDYWGAWRDLDFVFVQRDYDRVPEHWRTFGVRRSLITGNPRKATNPANAILNYLYSILEAEARIAVLKLGLDPGMGIMHADLKARDSLVCDLMEAVRPEVDAYVLDFLENKAFKKSNFFETREGVCRLMPSISLDLVPSGQTWSRALRPVVEFVAKRLLQETPTLLTESNRSAGRAKYRKGMRKCDGGLVNLAPTTRTDLFVPS